MSVLGNHKDPEDFPKFSGESEDTLNQLNQWTEYIPPLNLVNYNLAYQWYLENYKDFKEDRED